MAVVQETSPTGLPRHSRTSIPRLVPFRHAMCPIRRCRRDLPAAWLQRYLPPLMRGFFAWTDSLRPVLPYSGTIKAIGLDGMPEDPPAVARSAKNIPGVLERCTARIKYEKGVSVCARISPPRRG